VASGRAAAAVRGLRTLTAALALYARAAPLLAALRLVIVLATGLAPVATAWLTAALIDDLTAQRTGRVGTLALLLAGVGGAAALSGYVTAFVEREIGRRVSLAAQERLFAAVSRQRGLARLEDPGFHDRLRLAQQVSGAGPAALAEAALGVVQALLTVGGFTASLLTLSPLVTVLVLASTAPALAAQLTLVRKRGAMVLDTAPNLRRQTFYTLLLMDLRAAKEIRLYGLGGYFRGRMLTELRTAQRGESRVDRATLLTDGSLSLLTTGIAAAALYGVALRIAHGHGTAGDLAVLVAALAGLQGALAGVLAQIAGAGQVFTVFTHYTAILDAPADLTGTDAPPPGLRDGIRFEHVWFRYSAAGDWVLRDIDLTIGAGRSLALVGLNGAGKSTLVKLLCRLYEPTRGRVTWDGVDIRSLDPDLLRARIGAVFQDFMCYDLSAYDNIALGGLDRAAADPGAVERAATRAGVHPELAGLPAGYDTMLSLVFQDSRTPRGVPAAGRFGGVSLSGGQWQRVALARALLRSDADVLVLDEPSSGLDAEAEAEIHQRLRELRSGRTSLLISHRLGTVRDADRIVVLDGGRITEAGDHASLLAADGTYARLFRLQADGYRAAGTPGAGPREGAAPPVTAGQQPQL
jgi:ATP-binding cassette subfamily B protein